MTTKEAAAMLDGRQYGAEITLEEEKQLAAAGLVAVFGASDDLMEFVGALDEEIDACGGGEAYITTKGFVRQGCPSGDDCPHEESAKNLASQIEAHWCPEHGDGEDLSWLITTDIPHETFHIHEDGELFCIGVVFALADAKPPVFP